MFKCWNQWNATKCTNKTTLLSSSISEHLSTNQILWPELAVLGTRRQWTAQAGSRSACVFISVLCLWRMSMPPRLSLSPCLYLNWESALKRRGEADTKGLCGQHVVAPLCHFLVTSRVLWGPGETRFPWLDTYSMSEGNTFSSLSSPARDT